jgi:hypothetical protein
MNFTRMAFVLGIASLGALVSGCAGLNLRVGISAEISDIRAPAPARDDHASTSASAPAPTTRPATSRPATSAPSAPAELSEGAVAQR